MQCIQPLFLKTFLADVKRYKSSDHVTLDQDKLNKLLKEELIQQRVKIESFISTYLELRPASQITIPAEFPKGVEMWRTIDERAKPYMAQLQSIKDPRGKAIAIKTLKKFLEKSFQDIVEESRTYKTHYKWADELKIRNIQCNVRPTVHEIFLYKNRGRGRELKKILKDRENLRRKVQRNPDPDMERIRFAYPEEFNEKWIINVGNLFGYPECCSQRYAKDRSQGRNVEIRAANQLTDRLKENISLEPHAFPLSNFFPCDPECEKALELGKKLHEKLSEFDPRVGSMYKDMLKLNIHLVLKQPELIKRYISRFNPTSNKK
jgi:hypothetical protein